MRRYPLYIFDLDGTLYRGVEPVPDASEVLAELRRDGSIVRFLTNNSASTPEAIAEKLLKMEIEADPSEVLTSGMGAAHHLSERGLHRAFVVGEPGLVEVLGRKGVRAVGSDDRCDVVLAGICKSFTYDLMNEAMQLILRGAPFIATNTDASYPLEKGRLIPGAGAIVASIQTCSGKAPKVIGKPEPFLVQMILDETRVSAGDALVVGDRYETDIVSGQIAGCDTLLVLTGVTQEGPEDQPTAATLRALVT